MRVGVLTGTDTEARCLPSGLLVACSGADAGRADDRARWLVGQGATALVSFGLAGGIAAGLEPGTVLLPVSVRLADGSSAPVTASWRAAIAEPAEARPLAESRVVLSDAAAKRAFAQRGDAVSVDMESGAVARAALAAGLPFLVLRAIADPAGRGLPAAALAGVGEDGRVRPLAVAAGLLKAPWQLPTLLRLARDSGAGLAALRRVAHRPGVFDPPIPL